MAFRRGPWLAAGAVAVAAAVAIFLAGQSSGSAGVLVRLSAAPLGVNVAPWDDIYSGSGSDVVQPLLSAAGVKQLRYGGGSYADIYNWKTNTDIGKCLPNTKASYTAKCASTDPLGFTRFTQRATAIGANSVVTVNYGSGTPAMAAAWVTAARSTAGEHVALWEIGDEAYGCWEVNNELAGGPAHYQGYHPGTGAASGHYQSCPETTQGPVAGTRTLATSYAQNALRFMRAMKAADPKAVIGVPWAFGPTVLGGSVADSREWNNTVLGTDAAYAGFVDAHYYPFEFAGSTGGANPSDSQVLHALRAIPSLRASMKTELAAHDPGAAVVIGETAPSSSPTTTACTPVGALFAAGDTLSWLAAGAESVDWWNLNNAGNTGASCTNKDFGLFTTAAKPVPETPYYGYLLAAKLAAPGAQLGFLATSDPADVLAYQSVLPSGKHAVAFINLSTSAAPTVTFSAPSGLTGTLRSWTYSAGTQNAAKSEVVTGTTSVGASVTLPAESITILATR